MSKPIIKDFIKLIKSVRDVYTYVRGIGFVKVTKASLIYQLEQSDGQLGRGRFEYRIDSTNDLYIG